MSESDHDARCEREYTASGFIFIDCLCSLRRAKAEAWDEGHRTRWVVDESAPPCQCFAYSIDECACGNYGARKPATNPYRTTSPPPNPSTNEGERHG